MRKILMTSQLKTKVDETMVGTYRAESTEKWTAGSGGITTKIPPLFDVFPDAMAVLCF